MALIPIHNLGSIGIIKAIPPYELPPEAWTDGRNVRFMDNKVLKALGQINVWGNTTVQGYSLFSVGTPTAFYWVYAGLAKVYCTDMTSHYDITRTVGGDYSASATAKWTGGILNGVLLLNNGVDEPQMWNTPASGTPLANLTNWPGSTTCKALRPFRGFGVAMDITVSGTRDQHELRWSNLAAPRNVPDSWDYADATKLAGRVALSDSPGFLLDCLQLGKVNIVYKEDYIYLMQYVGGQSVFSFDGISQSIGMMAARCAAVDPFGRHVFAAHDDIVIHSGVKDFRSILTKRWKAQLFNNIDSTAKSTSFMVPNPKFREILFCYPETGATQPTRALVYNVDDGSLGDRVLGAASGDWETPSMALGVADLSGTAQNWDADSEVWDSDSTVWDLRVYDPALTSLVRLQKTASPDDLQLIDSSNTYAGTAMVSYAERTGLAIAGKDRMGNPKVDPNLVKLVKRLIPKLRANGPVTFRVGGQEEKESSIIWSPAVVFDPATDFDVPCDAVGRYIAVRIESDTDVEWELDSYDLDIEIVGGY